MHFRSAYVKLTLFYVLIVMIISIGFSLAIYEISAGEIDRGLGRQAGAFRGLPPDDSRPLVQNLEQIRLDQLAESSQHLKLNLIYFNLLILLLSAGISYLLAKQTLKPIEEMMENQSRFTADASHELKTPLTAMRAEIEVNLRDPKLDTVEARNLLKSNLEEIAKLEYLSSALLKLAKFEDDNKPAFEKVSLSEIISEAAKKVEKPAKRKSIKIEIDKKKVTGHGDRQSLVELFIILLDNAIKYSPEKSKVAVTVMSDKKTLVIEIVDQGIGIKQTDISHIFDRFYRADSSRSKEKIDGYGLGLSIAKRIVELHDGTIKVESIEGEGSKFIVKLPV